MRSNLNVKQWVIASVACFVVMSVLEYLVHWVILLSWYQAPVIKDYWRPEFEMMSRMHWMYFGFLMFSALFCYIYTKGYEGKPGLGEGFRYGLMMGALIGFPKMFIDHVVFFYPGKIIVAWGISSFVILTLMGLVVGMIYKSART